MQKKTDRNTRLMNFIANNPKMSNRAIGRVFHISGTRVHQIRHAVANTTINTNDNINLLDKDSVIPTNKEKDK